MKIVAILLLSLAQYAVHGAEWNYDDPDKDWAHASISGVNECGLKGQSPINIDMFKTTHDKSLGPLRIIGDKDNRTSIIIVNNGHSIQLQSARFTQHLNGGPLTSSHKLLQMHFHWGKDSYRGSEHTVNGKRYPIELHMVHQNEAGKLAVIGVFFDLTKADSNVGVAKIAQMIGGWETGKNITIDGGISPSMLLPSDRDYFTYAGSLTTPPCSEIVTWIVLREPLKINERDLNAFRSTLFKNGNPMVDNFRPVQPHNGRIVRSSFASSCSTVVHQSFLAIILTCVFNFLNNLLFGRRF